MKVGDNRQIAVERRWRGRPVLGRTLQIALFVFPFALALFVSYGLVGGMSTPEDWAGQIFRIAVLTVVSFIVIVATERVARLAAPVALLLRMTMVFPDKAPSRIRIALRSSSNDELRRTMAEARTEGLGTSASEAAETLMVLVAALDRHDRNTKGHSERTRAYADVIAGEMGLTTEERSKLRWAALLHDVGKMQIPSEILNKRGRLTDTEYQILKQHPTVGAELVEPLREFLGPFAEAVAQHHEWWDGKGYPYGLEGHEICVGARIVAVAETFDVITSLRSYNKPAPATEARLEIARWAGSQFDPEVVRAFLAISLGRFRWGLAPLAILTRIPQFAAFAGSMTTVATATPFALAGAVTIGALAVAADPTPADVAAEVEDLLPLESAAPSPTAVVVTESRDLPTTTFLETVAETSNAEATLPTSPAPAVTVRVTTIPATAGARVATTPSTTSPPTTSPPTTQPATTSPLTTSPPTTSPPTTQPATTSPLTTRPLTTRPLTTSPPTTSPPTTSPPGNPPNGVLPRVVQDCLGEPGVTAQDLRDRGSVDFYGCDLGSDGPLDLSGFDLSEARFRGGNWDGTIFNGADLFKAKFEDLSMDNARFVGADLQDFEAKDFSMVGTSFRTADLTDAKFDDGDLRNASFASTVIDGAEFKDVNSSGATFAGANISDTDMEKMGAAGASFEGARLTDVKLEEANIRNASFNNAVLEKVQLQKADISNSTFSGADFDEVNLDKASGQAQLGSTGRWDDSKCPDGDDETPYRTCTWIE